MSATLTLGISACLLGQQVRFDGGHKLDRYISGTLGQYVRFVPVCPEVECGLPVPREAMRLVGDPENPRLVTSRTGVDHTERMLSWSAGRVRELESEGLHGFIFKSGSPSSGMERIKVYPEGGGQPQPAGRGMFARAFMEHFPLLPVEDDGRLHDPKLRENFIERIFVMRSLAEFLAESPDIAGLTTFHARHKLMLLAHSPVHYERMGRMVAGAKGRDFQDLLDEYRTELLSALAVLPSRGRHENVLLHILGYFKNELSPDEKQEALELVGHYKQGDLPLVVPVTLLNHFVRKYGKTYLAEQYYLHPHPVDLRLRLSL